MERTLLLVDDEENITSALARLLRRDGYKILRANSGREGLELLAQNDVGVIISDQRMPGMTGTEFLSGVKDLYPNTVRIVLSGYTELNAVTDAINRGAVYKFLTKPWEDDLLSANVKEAFQRYEMKAENTRLSNELKNANDALRRANQELEQRVELKIAEAARSLSILQVSQEIIEHLPLGILGIANDGMIIIANQMAHQLLSEGGASVVIGEMAETVIPADMLAWALSFIHSNRKAMKKFLVGGKEARCWRSPIGEQLKSRGILLTMDIS